jgi:predicted nucleic acid-binding protein
MSKVVIGDADGLVALADNKDANHTRAQSVTRWMLELGYEVIFPNTAILEAITALKRAKNLPDKAHLINRQYESGAFLVEYVGGAVQKKASKRFEKTISKKNTIFDAVVAEIAIDLHAEYIFSFDQWYAKEGFLLAPEK